MGNDYRDLIKDIELNDIYLSKLNCQRTNDYEKLNHEINISFDSYFEISEIRQDDFVCKVNFNVSGLSENSEVLKIFAEFTVTYKLNDALNRDKELLDKFIKRNVPLNAWPYGRELISSMTVRMGLPPLIIATYKII